MNNKLPKEIKESMFKELTTLLKFIKLQQIFFYLQSDSITVSKIEPKCLIVHKSNIELEKWFDDQIDSLCELFCKYSDEPLDTITGFVRGKQND